MESNSLLEDLWAKLSDCEKLIKGMQNQTESDHKFLEEIKRYKSSEKFQEITAFQTKRNASWIPVLLFFNKKTNQDRIKESFLKRNVKRYIF